MPKKSQRKSFSQVQGNEVKQKLREDEEVLNGSMHCRFGGLESMRTRSVTKVVVEKMPETFNSSKKRNKEVPQTVQVQCKRPKKSVDKLDHLHSKCPDRSKSPNCRKSGDTVYSCNTQHLQKTRGTRQQSYSTNEVLEKLFGSDRELSTSNCHQDVLSVASSFSNESLNSEETSNPEEIATEEKPNKINGSIEENNNVQIRRHLESESNKSLEVADHKPTVPSFPVTRGVKGKSTRSSTRKTNCKYLSSKSENTEGKDGNNEVLSFSRGYSDSGSDTEEVKSHSGDTRKTTHQRTSSKTMSKSSRIMTPKINKRCKGRKLPECSFQYARQCLHVSAVPDTLPCREEEFEIIYKFVRDSLENRRGGCMYISGVPGTGKTATVHDVIRQLEEDLNVSTLPKFQYFEMNGMKLTDPNQAYCQLLKMLTGQKATPDHAASLLEKYFSQPKVGKESLVLLVDELDLLWTRKQNVMYNIFDWPTRCHSKLVVLAVANTMNLPERIMMNRVSSRLGLTRMTFQPYTFQQLEQIVLSRMNGLSVFEEDALQLVARKVAAVSGDARRCLDICRRAVEIVESSSDLRKPRKQLVGMKQVEEALKEMFSSPKILALQSLSFTEEMFVKALISELRRNGLEEALFSDVYDQFKILCRVEEGKIPPNLSQMMSICNSLSSCRLLIAESGNKDLYQRLRLNVNPDDAMFAFKAKKE